MTGSILNLINKRTILLDGGMGTELIKQGFPVGACPESWNLAQPEIIKNIHTAYFEAGSDAVLTNSFGGSKIKLASYDLDEKCYELNKAAAVLAKLVCPEDKFIGGSIGPTGKFLKPLGEHTEAEFIDAFREQCRGLVDGGVDFLLLETHYDLNEVRCGLQAARNIIGAEINIFVTMTFNKTPKGFFTIMGTGFPQFAQAMEEFQIPVIGANCTLDSKDMADLVKVMREATSLPLIAQANAGQPQVASDGTVSYSQQLDDYIQYIPAMKRNGARIIGGCCGTDPLYIQHMAEILNQDAG